MADPRTTIAPQQRYFGGTTYFHPHMRPPLHYECLRQHYRPPVTSPVLPFPPPSHERAASLPLQSAHGPVFPFPLAVPLQHPQPRPLPPFFPPPTLIPPSVHYRPVHLVPRPQQVIRPLPLYPPHTTSSEEQARVLPGSSRDLQLGEDVCPQEVQQYQEFAVLLRRHRFALGYSQTEVGQQLRARHGIVFSGSTISRFEAGQLPLNNVRKLKPALEKWMKDTLALKTPSSPLSSRSMRKRRASIDAYSRNQLETEFSKKAKPSQSEMGELASALGLEKGIVQTWFCNRRQRQKKQAGKTASQTTVIPSTSHDITVEVPGNSSAQHSQQSEVYIENPSM